MKLFENRTVFLFMRFPKFHLDKSYILCAIFKGSRSHRPLVVPILPVPVPVPVLHVVLIVPVETEQSYLPVETQSHPDFCVPSAEKVDLWYVPMAITASSRN